MKYLRALLYFFVPLLLLLVFYSTLNYFDILSNNIVKYANLANVIISSVICSIFVGKHSENKGYKEGIKEGLILSVILFIFTYLAFGKGINLERLLLYLIIIVASVIGSIIGINKRKEQQ